MREFAPTALVGTPSNSWLQLDTADGALPPTMNVAGEISAREVMDAHLARIDAVNPTLNAIVTLDREAAVAGAERADAALARGEAPGPLHGLPAAVKDLLPTAGMRTTRRRWTRGSWRL